MSSIPVVTRCALLLTLAATLAGCSDAETASLRDRLAAASAEAESLRAGREVLEQRLAATRKAAGVAGEHVRRLEQRQVATATSAAQWRDAHRAVATRLAVRERELLAIRAGTARMQGELAASARGLRAVETRNAALARQVAALNGWLGQHSAQGLSQGNALKRSEEEAEQRTQVAEELAERMAGIRSQLDQANSAVTELQASNRELDGMARSLNDEMLRTRQASDNRLATLVRGRDSLLAESEDAQVRAAELAATNEQLKVRMAELRADLVAANDQADRYRRAREYLDDKLAEQNAEMAGLRQVQTELRAGRDEVVSALDVRRQELLSTLTASERATAKAGARVAELERDVQRLRARVASTERREAASASNAEDFRRARDYLDGKLSVRSAEMESERKEHQAEVVRLKESLRLALEEVRLLTQGASGGGGELDAALSQAAAQREALVTQVSGLREEVLSISSERRGAGRRRGALLAQVASLREEVARALAAHAEAAAARDEFGAQLEKQQAREPSALEREAAGALQELNAVRIDLERTARERDELMARMDDRAMRVTRSRENDRVERAQLAARVDELTAQAGIYRQTLDYLKGLKERQAQALQECREAKG